MESDDKKICQIHKLPLTYGELCDKCQTYSLLRIPKRFYHVKSNSDYLEKISKGGILFTGSVGTGKTYELVSALLAFYISNTGNYPYPKFQTFGEIMREIRSSFANNSYESLYNRFAWCKLLVIDDLGTENKTEFSSEFIYNIINDRYNNCLPVLMSTNLTSEEITSNYSQRVTSRLIEMLTVVKLDGKDKRNNK